jgi:hypothetical protein
MWETVLTVTSVLWCLSIVYVVYTFFGALLSFSTWGHFGIALLACITLTIAEMLFASYAG